MMLVGLYLVAIIIANLTVVAFGPSVAIVNAFIYIGLDLTTRDLLHERWHQHGLVWKMAALIATGSLLSWLLNRSAGPIALASLVAFAAAATADTLMYHALRQRRWSVKVNGSNLISSAVDSLLFPTLAFGVFLPWIVLGQFVAKVGGGAVWSVILRWRRSRYA
jgi:uncharacterized PurR-regulated membrane protein YhhQ (DUF165 family)